MKTQLHQERSTFAGRMTNSVEGLSTLDRAQNATCEALSPKDTSTAVFKAQLIAISDGNFRNQLKIDPRGRLNDIVARTSQGGAKLSNDIKLVVLEDSDKTFHLVVPLTDAITHRSESPLSMLLRKASLDYDFAKELQRDPRGALEREAGIIVPEGVTLRVHVDSPNMIHIQLPAAQALRTPIDLTAPKFIVPMASSGTHCLHCVATTTCPTATTAYSCSGCPKR